MTMSGFAKGKAVSYAPKTDGDREMPPKHTSRQTWHGNTTDRL